MTRLVAGLVGRGKVSCGEVSTEVRCGTTGLAGVWIDGARNGVVSTEVRCGAAWRAKPGYDSVRCGTLRSG